MSWDVMVQKFSRGRYRNCSEVPQDEQLLPLGSEEEVRALISQAFPCTDWSDPSWGRYESEHGSIEFNMNNKQPCDYFMMHIRASNQVVPLLLDLCKRMRWQALDCGNGEFLEASEQPEKGLSQWQSYRDDVVGDA